MKQIGLILVILLLHYGSFEQVNGYSPIKDANGFKVKFTAASQQLVSLESDFTQTKNLSMLKDKIVSKGKFQYKKLNMVRIEYFKPYSYLMIINKNTMLVKDEQKKSNYNTRSNKIMQSVNNIMMDCMSGNVYNNKDFSTLVFENGKEYLLTLTPNTSTMKKMFLRIEVFLNKSDYHVLRLNMVELGGDNTLMVFNNRIINKNIDDNQFSTK